MYTYLMLRVREPRVRIAARPDAGRSMVAPLSRLQCTSASLGDDAPQPGVEVRRVEELVGRVVAEVTALGHDGVIHRRPRRAVALGGAEVPRVTEAAEVAGA